MVGTNTCQILCASAREVSALQFSRFLPRSVPQFQKHPAKDLAKFKEEAQKWWVAIHVTKFFPIFPHV